MRVTRRVLRTAVVLLWAGALLVSVPARAAGQMELAVIKGTVKDEHGQPLEGVSFRLRDPSRGREYVIKSDKDGRFYRRGLAAVEYELVAEKEGYQPIRDKVRLAAGTDRSFDFKLAKSAPEGSEEFMKGVEAFNRGDAAGAAAAFEQAMAKAPDAPEVRVNLAMAYLRLKRTAEAIAQLERASALAHETPRVLFQLGGAYVDARQNDKAIEAFEKGLARQPDLTDPIAYEAMVTLGAVYFATGRNDDAIARFQKALAARPDAPAPKLGLAKAYFSKGDVDQALRAFKEVVATNPGSPEAAEAEAFIKELQKDRKTG
ncbi:MAG TPA: tetratricopeptide repeat protein [Vicinamibacterales bacterium]|nr:tetratricopeptide repeat protein [Vicinamibacterales bacterium]